MLIFDEHNDAIILENVHIPTNVTDIWVLDFTQLDFVLTPLLVLEEVVSPSIELQINGFKFILPSNWHMLIADADTSQLDVTEISNLAGKEFKAVTYGPHESMIKLNTVIVTDYHPHYTNVGPSLNKHQMLCHPISPTNWVNVAPSDAYNKYLKNKVTGNLI